MTELAYEESGSGMPLVFLHGISSRRESWRPVARRLADRFHCVNVDLAGHGESPRDGAYDVFSQSMAVATLINDLGLESPVLVGHSYGAFVATLTAASAPVRGVVNIDQELDTGAFKTKIAPFEARLRGGDFAAAFDEFTATLGGGLVAAENQDLTAMPPDEEVVLGVWNTIFDTPAADLNALVEPVLAAFPVPYLAIFGGAISAEERRLLGLIPSVEIEEWEGMGHFLHLVDPARAAERIAAFAARIS